MEIAYWTNGLGEEMSSKVHARFEHDNAVFIVVYDWRERMRGHGFIILEVTESVLVRNETPR